MTHHAAMEYCRWLSAKTGKAYRLPTEAEWEYACRGRHDDGLLLRRRPGASSATTPGTRRTPRTRTAGTTHKVGKKKPNPWGLYDMHGNVAEWCLDHYDTDAYAQFAGRPRLTPRPGDRADREQVVARGPRRLVGGRADRLPQRRPPRRRTRPG